MSRTDDTVYQDWLAQFVTTFNGAAGTVHFQHGQDLELAAAHNIPPPVLAVVKHVPHGKGMAGLAQVRRQPVQTCNLQTDETTVKPGARAVNAQAGIALPVFDAGGALRAVVGIAFSFEGAISAEREQELLAAAARLP
ncbi:MAG: GAF domain-containing protein [Myxococcaceae bacterium]|nr:MAG: GAF domain-containing protein [Myxococcaceae bacterium]